MPDLAALDRTARPYIRRACAVSLAGFAALGMWLGAAVSPSNTSGEMSTVVVAATTVRAELVRDQMIRAGIDPKVIPEVAAPGSVVPVSTRPVVRSVAVTAVGDSPAVSVLIAQVTPEQEAWMEELAAAYGVTIAITD